MKAFCPCCGFELGDEQMEEKKCNICFHQWQIWHITPVNDVKPHEGDEDEFLTKES